MREIAEAAIEEAEMRVQPFEQLLEEAMAEKAELEERLIAAEANASETERRFLANQPFPNRIIPTQDTRPVHPNRVTLTPALLLSKVEAGTREHGCLAWLTRPLIFRWWEFRRGKTSCHDGGEAC